MIVSRYVFSLSRGCGGIFCENHAPKYTQFFGIRLCPPCFDLNSEIKEHNTEAKEFKDQESMLEFHRGS